MNNFQTIDHIIVHDCANKAKQFAREYYKKYSHRETCHADLDRKTMDLFTAKLAQYRQPTLGQHVVDMSAWIMNERYTANDAETI